jgi:resuscitation-promoting factor RpfA
VRCPRCQLESQLPARACPRCGAPLLLGEEPRPGRLDRPLDLERRFGPRLDLEPQALLAPPGEALGPADLPDIDEGTLEIHLQRAPGWRRAAAWVVDGALLAAVAAPPVLLAARALPAGADAPLALAPFAAGFAALLAFTYATLGHALMGATIGKRLLGLRVTGPDGGAPSLARSAARAGLAVLALAALGLPLLVALFTRSGRGLHDVVAGTVVVRAP